MYMYVSLLSQNAHDGMVSAMVCSKELVFTSSFGIIKVRSFTTMM